MVIITAKCALFFININFLHTIYISLCQANGLDERYNQVKCIQDRRKVWDHFLDPCVYAYNTAVHESTAFTPFQLMFGRKALLPIEIDIEDVDPEDLIGQGQDDMDAEAIQALADQRAECLVAAKENILQAQERQKHE